VIQNTSQLILGALLLSPKLLEQTTELNDSLFTGVDKEIFHAINKLWEETRCETIPILSAQNLIGIEGDKQSYLSNLFDPQCDYNNNYVQFQSAVSTLIKEVASKKIFSTISSQAASGRLDMEEIRPLVELYDSAGEHKKKLSADVRGWIDATVGEWEITNLYSDMGRLSPKDKAAVRQVLSRMVTEGIILNTSKKNGRYRKIVDDIEEIDFLAESQPPLDLLLPFGLHDMVEVYPNNIIVCSGTTNSGKTAFALEFVKMNMDNFDIHYFSSEMGKTELHNRVYKHTDIDIHSWRFKAYERSSNYADVIRPGKINVVDYLEVGEEFWRVANDIRDIYQRLQGGIALILLQKGFGKEVGRGGDFSAEKPRLYVTLDRLEDEACGLVKIYKAKNQKGDINPNGKCMKFKLVQGWKFIYDGVWEYPESFDALKKKGRLF
jgi:hypothetical protein